MYQEPSQPIQDRFVQEIRTDQADRGQSNDSQEDQVAGTCPHKKLLQHLRAFLLKS